MAENMGGTEWEHAVAGPILKHNVMATVWDALLLALYGSTLLALYRE